MRKGLWSPEEDDKLRRCISKYRNGTWSDIAKKAGVDRCGKSCRRRWMNHLRPDLKRGRFTPTELRKVVLLHNILGNKWSEIAMHLIGRTDNDVKNVWSTQIKRNLKTYYKTGVPNVKKVELEDVVDRCAHDKDITANMSGFTDLAPILSTPQCAIPPSKIIFMEDYKLQEAAHDKDITANMSGFTDLAPILSTPQCAIPPSKIIFMEDYKLQEAAHVFPPLMSDLTVNVNKVDSCTSFSDTISNYVQSSLDTSTYDIHWNFTSSYPNSSTREPLEECHGLVPSAFLHCNNVLFTSERLDFASSVHLTPSYWACESFNHADLSYIPQNT